MVEAKFIDKKYYIRKIVNFKKNSPITVIEELI
jgi:hypothetical protein